MPQATLLLKHKPGSPRYHQRVSHCSGLRRLERGFEEASLSKAELSNIAAYSARGACVSLRDADTDKSDLGLQMLSQIGQMECPARVTAAVTVGRGCSQGSRSFGLVGNGRRGNRALTIHCFLGLGSYCAKALRALNGFSEGAPVSSTEKRKWKISPGSGGGVCNGSAHSRHLVNSRHSSGSCASLSRKYFQSLCIQLAPPPANTSRICTPSFRVPILTDFPRHSSNCRGLNLKIKYPPHPPPSLP